MADSWQAEDGHHIDLRGLAPPDPLVETVAFLEGLSDDRPVIAHFDRNPELLFPELLERGWAWSYEDAEAGEVRLRLARLMS
ncbi:MAG: DUF2249 domain-containing protein [Hyphomicrobiales bacterium]|nr:DUF2249 domain-containing protein [Hyphomicrobiales bacterium]